MRLLCLIFAFSFSLSAIAKIALVTSFSKNNEQNKVERIFRKKIKLQPTEELIVFHKVDPRAVGLVYF